MERSRALLSAYATHVLCNFFIDYYLRKLKSVQNSQYNMDVYVLVVWTQYDCGTVDWLCHDAVLCRAEFVFQASHDDAMCSV